FSLYRSLLLHHLHSFPTRRSSDLQTSLFFEAIHRSKSAQIVVLCRVFSRYAYPVAAIRRVTGAPLLCSRVNAAAPSTDSTAQTRSEEHTSELQSRENLVCRLLLEK